MRPFRTRCVSISVPKVLIAFLSIDLWRPRQANMKHECEVRRQLERSLEDMTEAKMQLESAWATKLEGSERAQEEAEKTLQLQTKRWNQTREAHDRAMETLRTEQSQVTTDYRNAQRELEAMTSLRDDLQHEYDLLKRRLDQTEMECSSLASRVSELEMVKAAQESELQQAYEKVAVAREETDAVKKDYVALVDAGTAKDAALRSELAEVHRRAAANERAANDALSQERRDREKECAALRSEIFSMRETAAVGEDKVQCAEQQRAAAESMLRIVEGDLESSRARELEALGRVDQLMVDFSTETSSLRSKVTELSEALREAENSRLNAGQSANTLEMKLQQEHRTWQGKFWELQKQLQGEKERHQEERHRASTAASKAQTLMRQTEQINRDLRQFAAALNEDQYREKGVMRQLYSLQIEQSKRDDEILRMSNDMQALTSDNQFLRQENDQLVEEMATRDGDAGLEGFKRGVESCQAEIRREVCKPLPLFPEPVAPVAMS